MALTGAGTSGINVKLIGPWNETAKKLSIAPSQVNAVWRRVARIHVGFLRDAIRKRYKSAKPALAPSTILARKKSGRGGRKPLFVSGDLRGSVTMVRDGDAFFVGILRKKKGPFGSMVNLAELHENGRTFAVPATKKSKAFLAGVFGRPSIINSKADFFVVKIPARPVFAPAFKDFNMEWFRTSLAGELQLLFTPKPSQAADVWTVG